jgi:glucosamine--fructose-6-phosphate aminotransferase (isomerizing)
MNNRDGKYKKYVLIREMLEVKKVLAAMVPLQIFEFAAHIRYQKILLTGEGSSRIFPAKKVIFDARQRKHHHRRRQPVCGI